MKSIFKNSWLLTLILSLMISALGLAPIPAYAAGVVTVNSNADTTADDGACTLREAVANANGDSQLYVTSGECAAGSGSDTISFDSSLSGGTIYLASTLSLSSDMTIDGSALASKITLSGDSDSNGTGDVRVLFVHSGMTVTLDSLIITKGNGIAPSIEDGITGGGGILNNSGYNPGAALTVKNSIISGNSADDGGGVKNTSNSTLTITNSTISGNTATGNGGGILSDGNLLAITGSTLSGNSAAGDGGGVRNGNIMTLTNSTISGNSATGSGGGIRNAGNLAAKNNTLSGNSASVSGGGIYSDNTFNATNNIIANSTSGSDCSGEIDTNLNNLVEDGTCSDNSVNFVTGDPNLGALADNGGSTQTLALGIGSSAIDAGDDTTCAAVPVSNLDQRGVTRPVNVNCDIGAYELGPIVTKLADTNDGICDSDCSLREAIATVSSEDTVTFNSSLSGGTIHLSSTLNLMQNMTIDGSALASKITVSGDTDSNGTADVRVFFVHSGMTVTLNSLIITKGNGTGTNIEDSTTGGGGIQNNSGNSSGVVLTVKNSVISGNSADNGGGVYNRDQSTLTITNSTISGNTATTNGGGIYSDGTLTVTGGTLSGNAATGGDGGGIRDGSTTTLTNSTISGNSATGSGGGIFNAGSLTAKNNTLSGNSASVIGGGIYSNNTFTATNNIIANSTAGGDCNGEIDTNLKNLVEDGTCSDNSVNFVTGDPNLGALADNGGSTRTFALLTGSSAIDAGDDTTCTNSPVSNLDQRGVTRPKGSHCDIGAYEYIVPTFGDVPSSHPYFSDIEILYANGYTGGCSTSPLLFCPDISMSRAQAAVFMMRGNYGSGYIPPTPKHFFKDNWKNSSWGEGWAEGMFNVGLTAGCSPSPLKYCPDDILTNVQMAVFGLRLKYGNGYQPPAGTGSVFADLTDTSFWGTGWAEQAYADGLIPACGMSGGKPKFCPDAVVTRGFGASVIVKAKNLTMP